MMNDEANGKISERAYLNSIFNIESKSWTTGSNSVTTQTQDETWPSVL